MRVVDAAGAPVDCRNGDTLFVPAADRPVYILAGGSAEDLLSLLRVATPNHLPAMEISAALTNNIVTVHLKNITAEELGGVIKLILPNPDGKPPTLLAEKTFVPISPDKSLDVPLELSADLPKEHMLIAEITTAGTHPLIQRTALPVDPK
jgi:hypothetical protein